MGMLELPVAPGVGAGDLQLGAPVRSCVAWLLANENEFDRTVLTYNDEDPSRGALLIEIPDKGVALHFDGVTQRLCTLEFRNLNAIGLRLLHKGKTFADAVTQVTLALVYSVFGPTYPGALDGDAYVLQYDGMRVVVPLSEKHRAYCREHPETIPVQFPDGTTPIAASISLHARSGADYARFDPVPDLYYGELLYVSPALGVLFSHRGLLLPLGSSAQYALSKLGAPDTTHVTMQRKKIVWNYRRLGVDLTLEQGERVQCITVRRNLPGTLGFNEYNKANVQLVPPAEFERLRAQLEARQGARRAGGEPALEQNVSVQCTLKDLAPVVGRLPRPLIRSDTHAVSPFPETSLYIWGGFCVECTSELHVVTLSCYAAAPHAPSS